jgi:hypothetical protein
MLTVSLLRAMAVDGVLFEQTMVVACRLASTFVHVLKQVCVLLPSNDEPASINRCVAFLPSIFRSDRDLRHISAHMPKINVWTLKGTLLTLLFSRLVNTGCRRRQGSDEP